MSRCARSLPLVTRHPPVYLPIIAVYIHPHRNYGIICISHPPFYLHSFHSKPWLSDGTTFCLIWYWWCSFIRHHAHYRPCIGSQGCCWVISIGQMSPHSSGFCHLSEHHSRRAAVCHTYFLTGCLTDFFFVVECLSATTPSQTSSRPFRTP